MKKQCFFFPALLEANIFTTPPFSSGLYTVVVCCASQRLLQERMFFLFREIISQPRDIEVGRIRKGKKKKRREWIPNNKQYTTEGLSQFCRINFSLVSLGNIVITMPRFFFFTKPKLFREIWSFEIIIQTVDSP